MELSNPNGLLQLEKWRPGASQRIHYIPQADVHTIATIRQGVVFLMAFWSIASVRAFIEVCRVMESYSQTDLPFVVVDVDDSHRLADLPEVNGRLMQGNGLTLWVRDGRIVSTAVPLMGGIVANTLKLLSLPQAPAC
jgi:hypothetical protein